MNIQKATAKDIGLIQEIAHKSWNSHYPGIISQQQIDYMLEQMYSEKTLSDHFQNPNYHYYLIGTEGVFFGIMGYENHIEDKTTKLHRIYFLEEFKGLGAGKSALNFLKEKVKSVGDKRIILNVNKENPSYYFYLSQGFTVYKEIVLEIGNGYVMNDFLMEFRIV